MKKPLAPPSRDQLTQQVSPEGVWAAMEHCGPVDARGRYLHWDQMRHRSPPDGLTLEQWWLGTSYYRRAASRPVPLYDTSGQPFRFCNTDQIQAMVHRIDQQASGHILSDEPVMGPASSDHYLVSALVEEAITSSLLEGAATTRRVAKDLLRSGRRPTSKGEQMILNNFEALLAAEKLVESGTSLTVDTILDLHRTVTRSTLADDADVGRLQGRKEERVNVVWSDGSVLHRPPPAAELPRRMDRLCQFANQPPGGEPGHGFIHPVVHAIIVHFCIGYDHPFADGNGRVARALFYWAMLKHGYWLAQYLSISRILCQAPAQYARSYLYVETDDNDLTYFIIHQLQVIERAIKGLQDYLKRKAAETRDVQALLRGSDLLNHRQVTVVNKALRGTQETFTFKGHAQFHRVVMQSARTDLLGLESLGLFTRQRSGRKFVFTAVADLADRLRELAGT